MPELPEVETVVRGLRSRLSGRRLSRLQVREPSVLSQPGIDFERRAAQVEVTGVRRRGKWIVVELSNRFALLVHLRMTGRLTICPTGVPLDRHDHVQWHLDDGTESLRFHDVRRFGRLTTLPEDAVEAHLTGRGFGPEPLAISALDFHARLGRGTRSIKAALLDQRVVAGLGNIYADEILFAAGIDPRTATRRIGRIRAARIHRVMRQLLRRAIRARGTSLRDFISVDGTPGGYRSRLRVYRRAGEPCTICGRPVAAVRIAGRSTHFCRRCQR